MIVALGCNLPGAYTSREALLEAAVAALAGEGMAVVARSGWWTSAAWPDPTGPAYLNGVVLVETDLSPAEALAALHRVEAAFGRARSERNAARTLDLDLIAHGRTVTDGNLVLPHPRAHERLFVMGPLAQVAPDWVHPVLGERASDLAAKASVGADARPVS
ncbi:2-amino-4-hydroxy-6-hydroxymethyldihydropteridine diphosphokinase [Caulobacter endophyticus]|uniref:2-amino-4-hydroxy-6- hydroxymethyldihydropteridine diphosphokinase n=1 Tax=Caulobacter endophyticus TaxID=2172652 RepID=UPI00240F5AF0|nr:2-amino-4-hydroxy-6-hydroxymethyldihydropteridine diphosphokinase [Caulobacter endophyticus]MDG2528655.1 2-amino-4-hydroxy-6-hydroxymethyldihydropteridine diphosphokinase [Caulobacter endophyticus]